MTADPTAFLLTCIADDEAAAQAASPGPWSVDNESYPEAIYDSSGSGSFGLVVGGGRWNGEASVFDSDADALHIVRHHPARVLADCKAKRRIVELHAEDVYDDEDYGFISLCSSCSPEKWPCSTLRAVASVYVDRPDFPQELR